MINVAQPGALVSWNLAPAVMLPCVPLSMATAALLKASFLLMEIFFFMVNFLRYRKAAQSQMVCAAEEVVFTPCKLPVAHFAGLIRERRRLTGNNKRRAVGPIGNRRPAAGDHVPLRVAEYGDGRFVESQLFADGDFLFHGNDLKH
jgi:hypothetical protein